MTESPAPSGPSRRSLPTWLVEHPPFRRLAFVQIAHGAGDALIAVALAGTLFFNVPLGEARDRVGLYLLIAMTPYALLSPVVGPLLDRWRDSYRIAVVASATGRAVLAFAMASRTDRLWLYPLAFGALVLSRAHAVSRAALVPSVVPPGRTLLWANARLAMLALAGGVALGVPGAGLEAWLGPGLPLRAAGLAFAAAAVLAFGLPKTGRPERRETVKGEHRALARTIVAAGFGTAALRASVGFLTVFLAFALRAQGHGGGAFAGVVAAAALGGGIGTILTPLFRRVTGTGLLVVALAALAIVAAASAAAFGVVAASLVGGIAAISAAGGRLAFDSLVQSGAPEQVRGRAFARYETLFQLAWVAGAGLATAVPFAPGPGLRVVTVLCLVGAVGSVAGRYTSSGAPGP